MGEIMNKMITYDNNSPEIIYLCKKDKRLAKIISLIGPLSYEINRDPYSFIIHEIIEQMLSKKVGNKIYSRFVDLCEGEVTPEKVDNLTDEQIKSIGTANSKVAYIRNITNAVIYGDLEFDSLKDMNDTVVL